MITRFGALHSPDIQAPDKYLKRILPNSTNFFYKPLKSNILTCLDPFGPHIWNIQTRFSKKMKQCHFFWILSRFVRCMITRISAPDVADIQTSRIFCEHIHLIIRKLSTGRWSKKVFQKIRKKLQLNIGIFSHLSINYHKKCSLLSAACKNICRLRKYTFKVFIGCLNIRGI